QVRADLQQGITAAILEYKKLDDDFEAIIQQRAQDQQTAVIQVETAAYVKKANAIHSDLIAALQMLAATGVASDMADSLGVAAYLEGESLYATMQKLFKGTVVEQYLPKPPSNGGTVPNVAKTNLDQSGFAQ
ncbi:hypothetical protein LCGC14_0709620, partial [marine sediment metagenome]